ncbi:ATP-binding cassette domain-containing protein [bacterium]|nr:ATP-binding cassette domain-containing protein [bacterium]
MLELDSISMLYHLGAQEVRAVDSVSLSVPQGEYLRIVGASGSGKSTLLNLIAGMERPTEGRILTPEGDLTVMNRKQAAKWRARSIGMVFQAFHLVPHRTALMNVELGLLFHGVGRKERLQRAGEILEKLGLGDRLNHRPADLSGGEQQRVALARALVKQPALLLADEPTGNLDRDNAREIETLLGRLNSEGLTVLLVTHDATLGEQHAGRTVRMEYGRMTAMGSATASV